MKVAIEDKIENICSKNYIKEIKSRVVKYFLDIMILALLDKNSGLSGYDIIEIIQNEFEQSLSPGTVYSILYSIERKGLIKGSNSDGRKTVYALTDYGKNCIIDIHNSKPELIDFIDKFFSY